MLGEDLQSGIVELELISVVATRCNSEGTNGGVYRYMYGEAIDVYKVV